MSIELLIFAGLVLVLAIFFYFQLKKIQTPQSTDTKLIAEQFNQQMQLMQQQLAQMSGSLDKNIGTFQQQISSTNQQINQRLDKAAEVISEVSKSLGQMSEIGRSMQDFQSLLRSPKLRGGLGV